MTADNENAAPPCANVAAVLMAASKAEIQLGALKRSAEKGNVEPAPKRSRLQSWFGGPGRVLSALSTGCGTLLHNIRPVPSEDLVVPSKASPKQSPFNVFFDDPRKMRKHVGVVAFHHPGRDEVVDILCGAGFLSTSADLGEERLQLKAPSHNSSERFCTSEAAYQALRFWAHAAEFAPLSGGEALKLRARLKGKEDAAFSGYGDRWSAMLAAQRAKFATAKLRAALLQTEDAFLLAHDGAEGDATNCTGLQLMLLRDELSGKSDWTPYISAHIDVRTGSPKNADGMDRWRTTVQRASQQLVDVLKVRQMIPSRSKQPNASGSHIETKVVKEEATHDRSTNEIDPGSLATQAPTKQIQAPTKQETPPMLDCIIKRSTSKTSLENNKGCGADTVEPGRTAERPAVAEQALGRQRCTEKALATRPATWGIVTDDACASEAHGSTKRVRSIFEDEVVFSDLLRVQPEKEFRFAQAASVTTVTLKNVSQHNVAFKFKASTSSCLARPMTGTLQPGETLEALLTLAPRVGTQEAVSEKYLIQAMQVQSSTVLSRDEWAAMGKGSIREQRLPAVRDAMGPSR